MDILADIKHILHTLILFQCFLLAFFLLSQKKQSNKILAAFLIVMGITELSGIFYFFRELNMLIFLHCPHLFYLPYLFEFLYMPLLYFYVLSITNKTFSFRKLDLLHGLLFFSFSIYILLKYFSIPSVNLQHLISPGPHLIGTDYQIYKLLGHIQFFVYAIMSFRLFKSFRNRLKKTYSNIQSIDLSWLQFVIIGFIIWRSFHILEDLLSYFLNSNYFTILYIISLLLFLVLISYMVIKGLKQPEIFRDSKDWVKKEELLQKPLSSEKIQTYHNYLVNKMKTDKPFIDNQLTLTKLCEITSISSRHLSYVIKKKLNQNFHDFINQYRVEEVIKLFKDSRYENYSILAIALEAGFNSKSTFNSVFKKSTNMTPSQYLKTITKS